MTGGVDGFTTMQTFAFDAATGEKLRETPALTAAAVAKLHGRPDQGHRPSDCHLDRQHSEVS
ncbi:MAG: hypothetical protein ACL93V_15130 [Candidatus Electrothrix sp. YB6]